MSESPPSKMPKIPSPMDLFPFPPKCDPLCKNPSSKCSRIKQSPPDFFI